MGVPYMGYIFLCAVVFLSLSLSGCVTQTSNTTTSVSLRVLDAETRRPVENATVSIHYFPSSPAQPNDTYPLATTDNSGLTTLSIADKPAIWHIAAPGYGSLEVVGHDGHVPSRFSLSSEGDVDGAVYIYALPEPHLTIVVPKEYIGPVTIDLVPAEGFAYLSPDGANNEFLPAAPDTNYVQEVEGRRQFTVAVGKDESAQLIVTPLLFDLSTTHVSVQDDQGLIPFGDLNVADSDQHYVWGTVNDDDKLLFGQIRLFVGPRSAYLTHMGES